MRMDGWGAVAKIQVVLKDETEQKLRETIYKVRGSWKKGYISEAIEEAVGDWIDKKKSESKVKGR